MPFIEAPLSDDRCPFCGLPMHRYVQSGMLPWHADIELSECRNAACPAPFVTLTRGEHARLTEAQRAGYAGVWAARRAEGK